MLNALSLLYRPPLRVASAHSALSPQTLCSAQQSLNRSLTCQNLLPRPLLQLVARRGELSAAAAQLVEPLPTQELRTALQQEVLWIAEEYCDVLGEFVFVEDQGGTFTPEQLAELDSWASSRGWAWLCTGQSMQALSTYNDASRAVPQSSVSWALLLLATSSGTPVLPPAVLCNRQCTYSPSLPHGKLSSGQLHTG